MYPSARWSASSRRSSFAASTVAALGVRVLTLLGSTDARLRFDVAEDASAEAPSQGPLPGERWAYRARQHDPLVEVAVVRHGTAKPARVLVSFVPEEFEGRQDWVPPARLKTPWSGVEEFAAREGRWRAVEQASRVLEEVQYAMSTVFDRLIDESVAVLESRLSGVASIHDVNRLAALLDVPVDTLRAEPTCFVEEGSLVVPVATSELIARTAARADPEPVLRHVLQEEDEMARCLIYGKTYPARRQSPEWHVSAERYAEIRNEPYYEPCWKVLREWCGAEAAEQADELRALRQEVARIGQLTLRAVAALRAAGRRAEAEQIEHELGVPVGDL